MAHDAQDFIDGWFSYSAWIDDLRDDSEIIAGCDEIDTFKEGLLACRTNLERFRYIYNNQDIRNEVRICYKRELAENLELRQSRKGKSIEESKRTRELGNRSFKDGNYLEALKHYTQAIKHAPYPSKDQPDVSLALALANRSAALYSLTRFRLSLHDIDLALKFNYPAENAYKLLIRKVRCLHILSVWANDVEDIKTNLRQMLHNPQVKEFIKTEIANMFDFLENSNPEEIDKDEADVADDIAIRVCSTGKSLPNANDCIEMSYNDEKGRYLLMSKDASFGRLLIAEEPFVCNLSVHKRDQYCYNCFAVLHSCGLACNNCTQVLYCSLDCLEANSSLHAYECNTFLDFQQMIGIAYLVAHIMFKIDFQYDRIAVHDKKSTDYKSLEEVINIPASSWPDLVYKNDYASVVALQDHSEDYDYDSVMGYTLTAVYMMEAFIEHFPSKIPTDEQSRLVLGSLLLRHLMQLQTNSISIICQDLQNMSLVGHSINTVKEEPIGVGIYPTVSLLNHSCLPNIMSIFHNNKFVARASRSLECGTEVNYCYGPSVNRMSRKDRQARLKEQYFFDCTCDSCSNDKEDESRALICPKCGGPVIYNKDLTHKCMKCHESDILKVGDILRQVNELKTKLDEFKNDNSNDEATLRSIEENLKSLVHWKNPLFFQIKSQLIDCAEANQDLESALKYCREELELYDRSYGDNSLESIFTKLKFINLEWQRLKRTIDEDCSLSENQEFKEKILEQLRDVQATVKATRGKLKDLLNSTNIYGAETSFHQELKFLSSMNAKLTKAITELEKVDQDVESSEQSQSLAQP